MDGAMQQAAQRGRQWKVSSGKAMAALSGPAPTAGTQPLSGQVLKPSIEYSGQVRSRPVASGTMPI